MMTEQQKPTCHSCVHASVCRYTLSHPQGFERHPPLRDPAIGPFISGVAALMGAACRAYESDPAQVEPHRAMLSRRVLDPLESTDTVCDLLHRALEACTVSPELEAVALSHLRAIDTAYRREAATLAAAAGNEEPAQAAEPPVGGEAHDAR